VTFAGRLGLKPILRCVIGHTMYPLRGLAVVPIAAFFVTLAALASPSQLRSLGPDELGLAAALMGQAELLRQAGEYGRILEGSLRVAPGPDGASVTAYTLEVGDCPAEASCRSQATLEVLVGRDAQGAPTSSGSLVIH
jgi:hypothetical protein